MSLSAATILSAILIILFCMQGSYNGNNTIDEIFFGLELGLAIALFSHFYIRKRLDKHLTELMDGLFINRHRLVILGSALGMLISFTVITICYLAAVREFVPDSTWLY